MKRERERGGERKREGRLRDREGKWGDCAWRLRGSKFHVGRRRGLNDAIPGLLKRTTRGWKRRNRAG